MREWFRRKPARCGTRVLNAECDILSMYLLLQLSLSHPLHLQFPPPFLPFSGSNLSGDEYCAPLQGAHIDEET